MIYSIVYIIHHMKLAFLMKFMYVFCLNAKNQQTSRKKKNTKTSVPPRLEVTLWDTQFLLTKKGILYLEHHPN